MQSIFAGALAIHDAAATKQYREEQSKAAACSLRSVNEVVKYSLQARDGSIGNVGDFVVDDQTWSVQYIVVGTGSWLPGKKVLVARDWVSHVDWHEACIEVTATRKQVKDSPEYNPNEPVNREIETRLYDYYGRPA